MGQLLVKDKDGLRKKVKSNKLNLKLTTTNIKIGQK